MKSVFHVYHPWKIAFCDFILIERASQVFIIDHLPNTGLSFRILEKNSSNKKLKENQNS